MKEMAQAKAIAHTALGCLKMDDPAGADAEELVEEWEEVGEEVVEEVCADSEILMGNTR